MHTTSEYKAKANRLRDSLQRVLGTDCKISQSLEIIAHIENYPSWDALSGVSRNSETSQSKNIRTIVSESWQINNLMDLYKRRTGLIVVSGLTGTGKSFVMENTFSQSFHNASRPAVFIKDQLTDIDSFNAAVKRNDGATVFFDELLEIDVYWPLLLSLVEAGQLVIVSLNSFKTEEFIREKVPKNLINTDLFLLLHLVRRRMEIETVDKPLGAHSFSASRQDQFLNDLSIGDKKTLFGADFVGEELEIALQVLERYEKNGMVEITHRDYQERNGNRSLQNISYRRVR